jgi:hypothetical protein
LKKGRKIKDGKNVKANPLLFRHVCYPSFFIFEKGVKMAKKVTLTLSDLKVKGLALTFC